MENRYSISEASKILNISNELLRYYERKGIISPLRDSNGYRYFNTSDISILLGVRRFRNMGFSLEDMSELLYNSTYEHAIEMRKKQVVAAEKEIEWKKLTLQCMRKIENEYENMKQFDGIITETTVPSMLRMTIQKGDEFLIHSINPTMMQWIDCMPMAEISPGLPVKTHRGQEKVTFGLVITTELAEKIGITKTEQIQLLSGGPCLSTIIHSCGEKRIQKELFEPIIQAAKERNYGIRDDIWGLTLGTYYEDDIVFRYHRIYLPITKS